MTRRNRTYGLLLLILAAGFGYFLFTILQGLDPRYHEAAEDSLVDSAHMLAELVASDSHGPSPDPQRLREVFPRLYTRQLDAHIYGVRKDRVDLRVYVTDAQGLVLYDSWVRDQGRDFSRWRDVSRALLGEYGARTTLEQPGQPNSAVMYVAAPIRRDGQLLGVVSVGKPTRTLDAYVANARHAILSAALASGLAVLVMAGLASIWVAGPLGILQDYLRLIRNREPISLPRLGRRALGVLGEAYTEMRDALAGRNYVEEYVQALTHELKSPLSAIRGAAELLAEPMPEERRQRFSQAITVEALRMQDLVDRLLELAALEKRRGLEVVASIPLDSLLDEACSAMAGVAEARHITLDRSAAPDIDVPGDRFLLLRAVCNLLHNAIDFSPAGQSVQINVGTQGSDVLLTIRDHGPGIPDYALPRVFERFYSLRRPDHGQKSTGLGLSFVREIAELHHGQVLLRNHPDGGTEARLILPGRP